MLCLILCLVCEFSFLFFFPSLLCFFFHFLSGNSLNVHWVQMDVLWGNGIVLYKCDKEVVVEWQPARGLSRASRLSVYMPAVPTKRLNWYDTTMGVKKSHQTSKICTRWGLLPPILTQTSGVCDTNKWCLAPPPVSLQRVWSVQPIPHCVENCIPGFLVCDPIPRILEIETLGMGFLFAISTMGMCLAGLWMPQTTPWILVSVLAHRSRAHHYWLAFPTSSHRDQDVVCSSRCLDNLMPFLLSANRKHILGVSISRILGMGQHTKKSGMGFATRM